MSDINPESTNNKRGFRNLSQNDIQDEISTQNRLLQQYCLNSDLPYIPVDQQPIWSSQQYDYNDRQQPDSKQQINEYHSQISDKRRMVINTTTHPFDGLGTIRATFTNPNTKKCDYSLGTAFLVTHNLIMTAAHVLYKDIDKNNLSKGQVKGDKFQFFIEPLFRKDPVINRQTNKLQHMRETLINGIQARVVIMDKRYDQVEWFKRKEHDWVVLELLISDSQDLRTRLKDKPIQLNFGYDFSAQKDKQILIAGYPRNQDFQADLASIYFGQSTKIIRQKDDIHALYFHQKQPSNLSPCRLYLQYTHSTAPGTSGAPILLFNSNTQRYEAIGVHIMRTFDGTKGIGILFSSWQFKEYIRMLIKIDPNVEVTHEQFLWCDQQLSPQSDEFTIMIAKQAKAYQFSLKMLTISPKNISEVIAYQNTHIFPYVFALKLESVTYQSFKYFLSQANRIPYLHNLKIQQKYIKQDDQHQILRDLADNSLRLPHLSYLCLDNNSITGKGLKLLTFHAKIFPHLRVISLNSNKITDEGVIALAQNANKFPNLQTIQLRRNYLTDKAIVALVENASKFLNVRLICLHRNKITCQQLNTISDIDAKFPNLQYIRFDNNQITDKGFKGLIDNLGKFPKLQIFHLNNNKISDDGLKYLVQNGNKLLQLRRIYMNKNKITIKGLNMLVTRKQSIRRLSQISLIDSLIDDNSIQTQKLLNLGLYVRMRLFNPIIKIS